MSTARRLLYSLLVLLIFLVGLELIGRLLPAIDNRTPFAPHRERGWTLPVGTTFMFSGFEVNINRLGMRSPEPAENPALRVLTLGDSSAFGHMLRDTETFSAALAQRTSTDVQNGAVPGYTCEQSRSRYREVVDELAPDILLVYTLHNDVRRITTADEVWLNRAAVLGIHRLLALGQRRLQARRQESRVSISKYRQCLNWLAAAQATRGGHTLLISPVNRTHFASHGVYDTQEEQPYRDAILEIAEQTSTFYLDLTEISWAEGSSADRMMHDEVHPTAAGHSLIAKRIQLTLTNSGLRWPRKGVPQ